MASPQIEDGYTKIANELLEAFCRTNFNAYQRRVLDALIRKTYGYNKKQDWLSVSQIVEITGLKKQHISRAKSELVARKVVTQVGYNLALNKDWSQWQELPNGVTPHRSNPTRLQIVTQPGEHKRKKEKEIYKEISKNILSYLNEVGDRSFTPIPSNLENIIARLNDGHTEEECKQVIDIKWRDNDFDKKYFRPVTLFRASKFEGYLNERPKKRWDEA